MKDILHVFTKAQCRDLKEDYLVIARNKDAGVSLPNCKVMSIEEDFESCLNYTIPQKSKKVNFMMDIEQIQDVMNRVSHGVLSFMVEDIPYSVGINHSVVDGRVFFHCGKQGYKLNGFNQRAAYTVVEDLGVAEIGTYNYQSVYIMGRLEEVTDFDTKKKVLLHLVEHLAPQHPYNDEMPLRTVIFEIKPEFFSGKTHIL